MLSYNFFLVQKDYTVLSTLNIQGEGGPVIIVMYDVSSNRCVSAFS